MKICLACGQRFEAAGWRCSRCGRLPEFRQGYPAFAPALAGKFDGFEAQLFATLAQIEAGHFWFEARNCLLIWALRRYFPQARNFLEIGCGTGFVLAGLQREYPHLALSGSDIFIEGLTFAQARLAQATLWQMDARCIPFEAEFDVIGAFDVLEHIAEDETVLQQMFGALKPGGGIMVTVPQHPFLWSYFDDLSHHQRRYTRLELIKKIEQAGFKVCCVTSFVSFLLPILLLTRWRQHRRLDNDEVKAEFEHSWWVNAALKKVMDFERGLIKQGLSFPAGGSLLLVARR
ncbi:MAG: class I SAM-dependent methyltransferase [Anaerolineae bacterium]